MVENKPIWPQITHMKYLCSKVTDRGMDFADYMLAMTILTAMLESYSALKTTLLSLQPVAVNLKLHDIVSKIEEE